MALQVLGNIRILLNLIFEMNIAILVRHFLHAVVLFTPRSIVDVVLVVSGLRNRNLKEVGINQHRRGRHKATAGVAPDSHAVDVNEWIPLSELLHRRFFIRQSVIAQIAVSKRVIPLRSMWISAAITDL